ncbi:hypothetical protein [Crossiella sp. CA198]|uniref:hypothetical protein n=1 Tax=Crossiella sp. CA198 TaxID=3455607 RepID=UPI003F8D619D
MAGIAMLYSLGTAKDYLEDHGVPWYLAVLLPPAVDVALVVALYGDAVLQEYGVRTGWGTALRWVTAGMTLWLNCGGAVENGAWGTAALHAFGPVLVIVLTEAAHGYGRCFTELAERERQAASAAASTPVPEPVNAMTDLARPPEPAEGSGERTPRRRPERSRSTSGRSPGRRAPREWAFAAEELARTAELLERYERENGKPMTLDAFQSEQGGNRARNSALRNAALKQIDGAEQAPRNDPD